MNILHHYDKHLYNILHLHKHTHTNIAWPAINYEVLVVEVRSKSNIYIFICYINALVDDIDN